MSIMFVDKDIVWRWSAFDACGLDIRPEDLDGLLHKTYFSDSPGVRNSAAQRIILHVRILRQQSPSTKIASHTSE
jgi:hypothetical protein